MRDLRTITLRELLPPSIAGDPDILAAADAIDAELRKTTASIPGVSIIPRIREIADSTLIDLLAWQFHVDFYDPELPLETRRALVLKSLDWHTRKGTPSVVEEFVSTVFSDGKVDEWFTYGGEPYFFKITSNSMPATEEELKSFISAVYSIKSTRSWLEAVILELQAAGDVFVGVAYHEAATETTRIVRYVSDMDPPRALSVFVGVGLHEVTKETHIWKGEG